MEHLDVRQLNQDGSEFHWIEPAQALGLDAEPAYQFPITIDVKASRFGTRVSVRGMVRSRLSLECSRCLERFEDGLEADVAIEFLEGPQSPRRTDEIGEGSVEVSYYTPPFIALAEDLRQILLVAAPAYPVCRPSCRGLCPRCGANLNAGPCGCAPQGTHRPFEGLGSLKLKKE